MAEISNPAVLLKIDDLTFRENGKRNDNPDRSPLWRSSLSLLLRLLRLAFCLPTLSWKYTADREDRRGEEALLGELPTLVDDATAVVVRLTFTSTPLSPDRSRRSRRRPRQFSRRREYPGFRVPFFVRPRKTNTLHTHIHAHVRGETACESKEQFLPNIRESWSRKRSFGISVARHPSTMTACVARIPRIRI